MALKEETIIVEEKKAATQTLLESIGQEKAVVDAAVESSRGDEEAAATLQVHARVSTLGRRQSCRQQCSCCSRNMTDAVRTDRCVTPAGGP